MKNYVKYSILICILFFITIFIYFIVPSNSVNNDSEIPKMYLYGDLSNMTSKEDVRYLEVEFKSSNYNFSGFVTAKIQGASSTQFAKKNFNITFYTNDNYSVKKSVNVGFGKYNKYTLKADWPDGSKSRNVVTADIYSDIQKKYGLFVNTLNYGVIDGYSIELYLNDEFYGIYNLTTSKDYIYGLDENNKNHMAIMAKEYDAKTNFTTIATTNWKSFEVEVGEQNDYSLAKLNRLIRFVKNSSDEEFKNNFENYINLDSALNYYCYAKFGELYDNLNKNLMLVTYDGDYWYLTMYDLDISWGSTWTGTYLLDYTDMLDTYINSSMLWSKFERAFPNEIAKRYEELRSSILTKENILARFNSYYSKIPSSSFELEEKKWGPLVGYGVDQIEDFLEVRIKLVDKDINNLKTDEYDELFGDKTEVPDVPEDTNTQGNVNQNQSSNNESNSVESKPPVVDNPSVEENESEENVEDNTNVEVPSEDEEITTDKENNEDVVTEEKEIVENSKNNNYVLIVSLVIFVIIVSVILITLIILKIKNK